MTTVFCLADTNACHSAPCFNGGTCWKGFNGYHCQCVDGFTGDVCTKREFAVSRTIMNVCTQREFVIPRTIMNYDSHKP